MNTINKDVQLHKGIETNENAIKHHNICKFFQQDEVFPAPMKPVKKEALFNKEAFLKSTLLHGRTTLKLRFLRPAWTRTYKTYLHDFQCLPTDACTPEKQQDVLEFVQRIWDHSVEV